VIFSGKQDAYKNKLRSLLEKIMEVLKDPNAHPNLLVLVLFCFRILILRLSSATLNELFRNIWATLLSLLINIFDRNKYPTEKNLNLIYSALKLIEMISIVQLEEFYIHQWIFVFDCSPQLFKAFRSWFNWADFGVKIEGSGMKSSQNQEGKVSLSDFSFVPYTTSAFPPNSRVTYGNMNSKQDKYPREKRRINLEEVWVSPLPSASTDLLGFGQTDRWPRKTDDRSLQTGELLFPFEWIEKRDWHYWSGVFDRGRFHLPGRKHSENELQKIVDDQKLEKEKKLNRIK
jgi:hypothetical protein